jgi:hypothetical protein
VRALPQLSEAMPIRLRKFVGAIMLIVLVVAWALMPMALAQSPLVKANGAIEVIHYVVAGLGWVLPATPQHRATAVTLLRGLKRYSRRLHPRSAPRQPCDGTAARSSVLSSAAMVRA